ncbi:MAG: SOS response-associated peptidase family protein, partial [Bdellovibrionia bacterium]
SNAAATSKVGAATGASARGTAGATSRSGATSGAGSAKRSRSKASVDETLSFPGFDETGPEPFLPGMEPTGSKSEDSKLTRSDGSEPSESNLFRIAPHLPAPVIIETKNGRELRMMNFSLIPSWSKEARPKFATYNARLETPDERTGGATYIFQKPTWKQAFERRHCLVPIDKFVEPAYHGKLAGNMVSFSQESEEPMTAAGIWETWENRETGEIVESFTILTDDPIPFVEKSSGHDRSPVFLNRDAFAEWLATDAHQKDGVHWIKFLRKHRADYDLEINVDRPMKPGWEKRR